MSIKAISWSVHDVKGLTKQEKLLLIILANYADEDNITYPSNGHLLKLMGGSERALQKSFLRLIEVGLVKRHRRTHDNGANMSSLTELMVGKMVGTPPSNMTGYPVKNDTIPPSNLTGNTKEGYESMKPKEKRAIARKTVTELNDGFREDRTTTIEEVLAGTNKKQGKYRASVLSGLWKNLHRLRGNKTFMPEITGKELGMFTNMEKRVGDRVLPAMVSAVTEWDSFVLFVKKEHGKMTAPKRPTIAYLLKYIAEAYEYSGTTTQPIPGEETTPTKPTLTKDYVKGDNQSSVATKEQVADLLKDI